MTSTHTKIEIRVEVNHIHGGDLMSAPDPIVLLYEKRAGDWTEISRTEEVKDKHDVKFETSLFADLAFGSIQPMRIRVHDVDNHKVSELLGQIEFNLASLARQTNITLPLIDKDGTESKKAKITLNAEEVSDNKDVLIWTVKGQNLPGKDKLGMSSDPYVMFKRQIEGGKMVETHRLPTIKGTKNPTWEREEVKVDTICKGNAFDPIYVEIYDEDDNTADDYMCESQFNLQQLHKGGKHTFSLALTDKQSKKPKPAGTLSFEYEMRQTHSWMEYIRAGTELNFIVFIDFTQSNGDDVHSPDSLHYDSPNNAYLRATKAIYNVINQYDTDGKVPAFGYGAKLPGQKTMNPCFPLDYDAKSPEVSGFAGFQKAYYKSCQNIRMYGPTLGQPICQMAQNFASNGGPTTQRYTVALVLTDGDFTDMGPTTREIISSSKLPMSYVFIGVGSGSQSDWDKLDFLDGDTGPLVDPDNQSVKSERDITQFVPFEKFAGNEAGLAAQVLGEIPQQMEEYFTNNGLVPGQGISK